MTTRIYCGLDRNRMGPGLSLDESGLIVSTLDIVDINRMILGDLPALSGDFGYEVYIYSTLRASLANLVSFGVAQPGVNLSTFVGAEATSWGFRIGEGKIYNNNAVVATIDAQGERQPLGLHLSLSPTLCTCEWLVGTTVVYTATLANGKAWLPALSLGSSVAGDVAASMAFGLNRFDRLPWPNGWSQQTAGLATINLSLFTEAFMSLGTDTPANTAFAPLILNGKSISSKRSPTPWFHRTGNGKANPAALTTIQGNNADGAFEALLDADAKYSRVVFSAIDAPAGGVGSIAGATPVFTGILDAASQNGASTVDLVLRGTLAEVDMPLPMRVFPPFLDPSVAGKVRPVGLGAQRNVQPLLVDEPNRLFALGDAAQSNITLVADQGAALDPVSLPPQWTSAMDHEGLQLQTLPDGRLSTDCSSVGQQFEIPGAEDVLNGDGAFATWPGVAGPITTTPPNNFHWSGNAGATLYKFVHPPYAPTKTAARVISARPWYPLAPFYYGDYLDSLTQPVLGGRSYRLTFKLVSVYSAEPATTGGLRGGLMVRTALSNNPADAVTAHGIAISSATGPTQSYSIDFRVPPGAARPLYFIGVASQGLTAGSASGSGGFEIMDVRVELLSQATALPLSGITCRDAFTEILVNRKRKPASCFSAADCDALDALYGPVLSLRWEDTPNIIDALTLIADQYGAVIFEDELGVYRIKQLTDPAAGTVVASFSESNIDLTTFKRWWDTAPGLTTQFGVRPNCTPFSAQSDFVSDTVAVPIGLRAQYERQSQFLFSSNARLANAYSSARGAPRNHQRFDDLAVGTAEADRVVGGLFGVRRRFCSFDALFEGLSVGLGPSIPVQQLYFNHVITVNLPKKNLVNKRMAVYATEPFVFNKKISLVGWYS